nr:hypothetical protein [Tanacetum cinerariifolium]
MLGLLMHEQEGENWSWRFPNRGRAIDDLSTLISCIGSLSLSTKGRDKWQWAGDTSGIFKVNTHSKRIQSLSLADHIVGNHHYRNPWIPRKVNICVWRALLNKLTTRSNLSSRGVVLDSFVCPFCDRVDEVLEHCIISCPLVLPIWRKVWSWWNLEPLVVFPSFSISDIANGNIYPSGNLRVGKVLQGIFQITIWALWKWRNRLVNASADLIAKIKDEDIVSTIQRLSKTGIAARLTSKQANWDAWITRPFDLFV